MMISRVRDEMCYTFWQHQSGFFSSLLDKETKTKVRFISDTDVSQNVSRCEYLAQVSNVKFVDVHFQLIAGAA